MKRLLFVLFGATLVLFLTPQVDAVARCKADCNSDGRVDLLDLNAVISAWGTAGGRADINGNGLVEVDDLIAVILNWGCTSR
jgi:hypothetical protein